MLLFCSPGILLVFKGKSNPLLKKNIEGLKMFRIRRIYDDNLARDKEILARVRDILKEQFPLITDKDAGLLPSQLKNPLKHRFRSILFASEDQNRSLSGFAVLMHAPDLDFGYLDFISTAGNRTGGGVGGALYQRVRDDAISLNMGGIFFECLADDERVCKNSEIISQNRSRLKFYERFGARPIIRTAYETPLKSDDDCPPYLVLDPLDREPNLSMRKSRLIVRAILERRYGHKCPPGYIDMVVESFRDDPIRLRDFRYIRGKPRISSARAVYVDKIIALCVNDRHDIHHVHERGYVQAPVRISSILNELDKTGLFERFKVVRHSKKHILEVHDKNWLIT
jgi:hypothetical protein